MILTPENKAKIVAAIKANPKKAVTLPDHAYTKSGRVLVLIDGLPTELHRHLYEELIGPLGRHQRMHNNSKVKGNVNPYLFTVVDGAKSPNTHCPKGHPYAGNEMPTNSRGYRCRICYLASLPPRKGGSPAERTHCPQGHPYDAANTIIDSAGRRRCRICRTAQSLRYTRKIRQSSRKETTP